MRAGVRACGPGNYPVMSGKTLFSSKRFHKGSRRPTRAETHPRDPSVYHFVFRRSITVPATSRSCSPDRAIQEFPRAIGIRGTFLPPNPHFRALSPMAGSRRRSMDPRTRRETALNPRDAIGGQRTDAPPLRLAPYGREVNDALRQGRQPSVYLFSGARSWDRAERRRLQFGPGTALVLPCAIPPSDLCWPRLDAVLVAWPDSSSHAYRRKVELARALIRDGVRFAVIEHEPQWISAWRKGSEPK